MGLTARSYPIAADTAVEAGQLVKLTGARVALSAANETGQILGVAAENHPGVADALNARANGTEILVYDNPGLIFECSVPRIEAASGTETTVTAKAGEVAATIADGAFTNAVLRLRERAAASANPDSPGTLYRVTGYTKTGTVLTHAGGGAASAGDVYELYPPIGSAICGLDDARKKLLVSATGATSLRVIGHDYDRGMIRCLASKHALGGV